MENRTRSVCTSVRRSESSTSHRRAVSHPHLHHRHTRFRAELAALASSYSRDLDSHSAPSIRRRDGIQILRRRLMYIVDLGLVECDRWWSAVPTVLFQVDERDTRRSVYLSSTVVAQSIGIGVKSVARAKTRRVRRGRPRAREMLHQADSRHLELQRLDRVSPSCAKRRSERRRVDLRAP